MGLFIIQLKRPGAFWGDTGQLKQGKQGLAEGHKKRQQKQCAGFSYLLRQTSHIDQQLTWHVDLTLSQVDTPVPRGSLLLRVGVPACLSLDRRQGINHRTLLLFREPGDVTFQNMHEVRVIPCHVLFSTFVLVRLILDPVT